MEENRFDLVPVLEEGTGNYVIKNYDSVLEKATEYVESALKCAETIEDETAYKVARSTRTDLRKHKDAIQQARLHINALLLGKFNDQLKQLESMLDTADKAIKAKVDDYKESQGKIDNRQKVITLIVKGYDEKAIAKIKAQAIKSGLSAEVK